MSFSKLYLIECLCVCESYDMHSFLFSLCYTLHLKATCCLSCGLVVGAKCVSFKKEVHLAVLNVHVQCTSSCEAYSLLDCTVFNVNRQRFYLGVGDMNKIINHDMSNFI